MGTGTASGGAAFLRSPGTVGKPMIFRDACISSPSRVSRGAFRIGSNGGDLARCATGKAVAAR